jgi:hypothetical protein
LKVLKTLARGGIAAICSAPEVANPMVRPRPPSLTPSGFVASIRILPVKPPAAPITSAAAANGTARIAPPRLAASPTLA